MNCIRRRFSLSIRAAGAAGAAAAIALASFAAASAPASAATYLLRPAKTTEGFGWAATPSSSTPDAILAAPVTQPSAPSTSSFVTGPSFPWWNNLVLQVAAPPALATGESATSATAWVYLATGATQPVTVDLGSGNQQLASTQIAGGKSAGWYSVNAQKAFTPTDLGQLTISLQVDGSTNTTYTKAYAAYVQLDTQVSTPTVSSSTAAPASTPLALPQAPRASADPVSFVTQSVAVGSASKSIPLTLGCPAATPGGCHGTLSLSLLGPAPTPHPKTPAQAKTSRCARGCRVLGHTHFDILAGRSKHVKVHLAHSASTLFHGHSRIQLEATATTRDASGHAQTSKTTLTITRATPAHPGHKRHAPAAKHH